MPLSLFLLVKEREISGATQGLAKHKEGDWFADMISALLHSHIVLWKIFWDPPLRSDRCKKKGNTAFWSIIQLLDQIGSG